MVFGAGAFMAGWLTLMLPETLGRQGSVKYTAVWCNSNLDFGKVVQCLSDIVTTLGPGQKIVEADNCHRAIILEY